MIRSQTLPQLQLQHETITTTTPVLTHHNHPTPDMSAERFKFLQCTFYQQTLVCTNFPGTPIAKETLPQRPSLDKIAARTDLAGHVTKFIKESFPGWYVLRSVMTSHTDLF